MFPSRYFAPTYFAPRYFPPVTDAVEPPDEPPSGGGGRTETIRRKPTRISLDRPIDDVMVQLATEDEELVVVLIAAYKAGVIP